MNYNNRNIVINELIGLKARIIKSLDGRQRGISGTVIDETKNTLVLETDKGAKTVMKNISVFRFYSGTGSFTVKGEEIGFRPHERIERSMRFYRARK